MIEKLYYMESSVKFDAQLRYGPGMNFNTVPCPMDSTHSARNMRSSLLRIICSDGVRTDFMWTVYEELIVPHEVVQIDFNSWDGMDVFLPGLCRDTYS